MFIRPDQVLPETRARVQQAVIQLGYVPDRSAGGLATRRSGFVGLVLPILANSNFGALAEGLTETLHPAGYELLIGYTTYCPAEEERQVRAMVSRRPEALILTASAHGEAMLRLLAHAGPPMIEIAELPERPIGHAIGFSNHAVGMPTDLIRADGEIPVSFEQGARAMGSLLDDAPDVDAVFAVSDLSAVGALMECRRRGIDIPGRLSLIGFGNFEIGQQMVPPLTTIDVDFTGLGRHAGRMIIDLLRHGLAGQDTSVDVGFTLIPRGTTRAAG